jgi:hypothetical protein
MVFEKKTIVFFLLLSLMGELLLMAAATDVFSQSLLQRKNLPVILLMAGHCIMVLHLLKSYQSTKGKQKVQ